MTARVRRLLVAALLLGSCSSSGGAPAGSDSTADAGTATSGPTTTLDESPFCLNVRALQDLGGDSPTDSSPAAVLEQSDTMLAILDELAVTVPAGSPPDIEALIDDFRAINEAIARTGGVVDEAYAGIQRDQPELYQRISEPNSHLVAFRFFAERCGTPLP